MALRPPLLPRSSSSVLPGEPEGEGPLWNTIKRQLYRSEVTHIKRLVGDALIQQNRVMWDEIASLKMILSDFQEQNDELSENAKQQVKFCSSQHRDLLRRQAQIILDDIRVQAKACGHELEDLVPEFRNENLREFMVKEDGPSFGDSMEMYCKDKPMTPSTRPSSSGGVSRCSTPDVGFPSLPLGRSLGFDELAAVAEGIREALESEKEALLATIGEQMQCLEAEELRRATAKAAPSREPSTAELQQLVHKLQDLAVNPSLRSLSATGPPRSASPRDFEQPAIPMSISGGGHVRRVKALIAQRRRFPSGPLPGLGAVREASPATPTMESKLGLSLGSSLGSTLRGYPMVESPVASAKTAVRGGTPSKRFGRQEIFDAPAREKTLGEKLGGAVPAMASANLKPGFDPFFDDPFA